MIAQLSLFLLIGQIELPGRQDRDYYITFRVDPNSWLSLPPYALGRLHERLILTEPAIVAVSVRPGEIAFRLGQLPSPPSKHLVRALTLAVNDTLLASNARVSSMPIHLTIQPAEYRLIGLHVSEPAETIEFSLGGNRTFNSVALSKLRRQIRHRGLIAGGDAGCVIVRVGTDAQDMRFWLTDQMVAACERADPGATGCPNAFVVAAEQAHHPSLRTEG
jgi:hypothetical protein